MLEWSDDREPMSHSKQYLLHRLVDISSLTSGHGCKLTIEGFEYPSVQKSSLGCHFFMSFFPKHKAKLSKFCIDSFFENQKIITLVPHTNLDVISRKVRKFCTFFVMETFLKLCEST